MALKLNITLPGGITVPAAYLRFDRTVLNHKTTVVGYMGSYVDQAHAEAHDPCRPEQGYSFAWPVDANGAPVEVTDAEAFCYVQAKTLPALAGAVDA